MSLLEQLVSQCSSQNIYYSLIDDIQRPSESFFQTSIVPLLDQKQPIIPIKIDKDHQQLNHKKIKIKLTPNNSKYSLLLKKSQAIHPNTSELVVSRTIQLKNQQIIPPTLQKLSPISFDDAQSQLNDNGTLFIQPQQFNQVSTEMIEIMNHNASTKLQVPKLKIKLIKQNLETQNRIELAKENRQRLKNQSSQRIPIKLSIYLTSPDKIKSSHIRYQSQISKKLQINTNRTDSRYLKQIKLTSPVSISKKKKTLDQILTKQQYSQKEYNSQFSSTTKIPFNTILSMCSSNSNNKLKYHTAYRLKPTLQK